MGVYALWTWYARGVARRELVHVRLDSLRNRVFPVPDVGDKDYKLECSLGQVAITETVDRKAP